MDSKQQTGFTLLELMVTVAILAVITAIAIPAYSGYISSARRAECLNVMAEVNLAQDEHFLEFNSYFTGNRASGDNSLQANSQGYYNGTFSTDDNCTYQVVAGPTTDIATSYKLTATGTNQLSGTINTFTKQ